ncbi:MAG: PASTA domain-containing protein [Acidimicrobiales bacterium]|nr:PASTA domain-containing protein [Acidimicrobiales bacterium]MDG2217987.1 PASTA domain-containing protein [Acidimicrobiales bacterium]
MTQAPLNGDIGRVLGGRYRLVAPVGSGASARVYLADDVTLRRRVAVKVLHEGLSEDDAFLRRFRAEAQTAASLNNPHVLGVYDWGHDAVPFLVTEYLGGGSLRGMLEAGERLTLSQALLTGLEAARGLDYAHGHDLIHRDIKPANLLYDESGRLRIADFGLARAIAEAGLTDQDGSMVGTVRYSAPEQARGERVGPAADIYALALVINEAVTGEVPFVGDTAIATLMARADTPFEADPALGPMQGVLRRCGALDPAQRPSAGELAAELMASATDLARPTPLPLIGPAPGIATGIDSTQHGTVHEVSPVGSIGSDSGSEEPDVRWPWAIVGLIGLIAIIVGGYLTWDSNQPVVYEVPDVAGQTRVQATEALGEIGLVTNFSDRRESGTSAGEVLATDPVAGTEVAEGDLIVVYVSLGEPLIGIPNVDGLTAVEAIDRLEMQGLTVGTIYEEAHEEILAGYVIKAMVPTGVIELEPGSGVDLRVSTGPATRAVPTLPESLDPDAAESVLTDARLMPNRAHEFSDNVPEGLVIRFEPSVGALVDAGTSVTIVVSDGPAPRAIPAVIGLDVDEATALLREAGFAVSGVQGDPSLSVLATDPPAGELHLPGTSVVIATQLTSN